MALVWLGWLLGKSPPADVSGGLCPLSLLGADVRELAKTSLAY